MVTSMTGYGSGELKSENVSILIEISSVNHRFFKLQQRLPSILSPYEKEIESIVRKQLKRGSVNLSVKGKFSFEEPYRVNLPQLNDYLAILKSVQKKYNFKKEIDPLALMGLPGVLSQPEVETLRTKEWLAFKRKLLSALTQLHKMREKEGKALGKELSKRITQIKRILNRVSKRAPKVVEEYRNRLRQRLEELLKKKAVDLEEKDLAREITIFADHSDITEELVRLKSHIRQFEDALAKEKGIGRKLDFIIQEMLREANTLGAKANDEVISVQVIDLKTEIEKAKEQVQNVE